MGPGSHRCPRGEIRTVGVRLAIDRCLERASLEHVAAIGSARLNHHGMHHHRLVKHECEMIGSPRILHRAEKRGGVTVKRELADLRMAVRSVVSTRAAIGTLAPLELGSAATAVVTVKNRIGTKI